jgi:hypothetical protein
MTSLSPISFEDLCQRLLALFEGGRFNATYKYAVLIGLLDVLSERVGPHAEMPDVVGTRDLARAVLELYWPHARRFDIPRFDEAGNKLVPISKVLRLPQIHVDDARQITLTLERGAAPAARDD